MLALRRSRFEIRLATALLLSLPAVSLGVGPVKFSCPPGTQIEKRPHSSEPADVELCRDPKTGFREGPYRAIGRNGRIQVESTYRGDKLQGETRIYDDQGQLTHIAEYSNGTVLGTRMTRVGLENTFRALNEKFKKNGRDLRIAVIDEETVEYLHVTRTKFAEPAVDVVVMRKLLVEEGSACNMFRNISNIQTVIARYVDEAGKELLVVPLRRADCVK